MAEVKLQLKSRKAEVAGLLNDWYKMHSSFSRFMLTDVFLFDGIQAIREQITDFDGTLESAETHLGKSPYESGAVKNQIQELFVGLEESRDYLDDFCRRFESVLENLDEADKKLYQTLSLRSLRASFDTLKNPPGSYFKLKLLEADASSVGLFLVEVFEKKQESIYVSLETEFDRIGNFFSGIQLLVIGLIVLVCAFFAWRIIGINQTLVDLVRLKTSEVQNTLKTLKDTQEILYESRRQAALSSLIVGLSHEINTPLGVAYTAQTAMEENFQALLEQKNEGKLTQGSFDQTILRQQELLALINRNLRRITEQVKYFQSLSGPLADEPSSVIDLEAYFGIALKQFQQNANRLGFDFEYTVQAASILLENPRTLIQILSHVFQNSLSHAFEGRTKGLICLNIKIEKPVLVLEYSDDGKGLGNLTVDQIMEPFFTTARGQGHMGLGLNIVHNLLSSTLKGSMEIFSPEQGGLFIVLKIPYKAQ